MILCLCCMDHSCLDLFSLLCNNIHNILPTPSGSFPLKGCQKELQDPQYLDPTQNLVLYSSLGDSKYLFIKLTKSWRKDVCLILLNLMFSQLGAGWHPLLPSDQPATREGRWERVPKHPPVTWRSACPSPAPTSPESLSLRMFHQAGEQDSSIPILTPQTFPGVAVIYRAFTSGPLSLSIRISPVLPELMGRTGSL